MFAIIKRSKTALKSIYSAMVYV